MHTQKYKPNILVYVVRFVIICVIIFVSFKAYQWFQLNKILQQLKQEQTLYQQQITQLEENIRQADTDFFIEKMVREESELAKPGDFVIKFKSN